MIISKRKLAELVSSEANKARQEIWERQERDEAFRQIGVRIDDVHNRISRLEEALYRHINKGKKNVTDIYNKI